MTGFELQRMYQYLLERLVANTIGRYIKCLSLKARSLRAKNIGLKL